MQVRGCVAEGRIDGHPQGHRARVGVEAVQGLVRAGGFRDNVDAVGGRVVGGSAGDADGIDVPARELRSRHRFGQVGAPAHGVARDGVDRVVLGGGDHGVAHHDRPPVDGSAP
ncbi:hypothetical protein, partial [Nocardia seriolae]|uniref:hypothetical protein n=1 Tax=Nocardia seriolae TaxID=37332 RepID=UPI001E2A0F38